MTDESIADNLLRVARSLRVPGLGLLLLPTAPAPAWLLASPLHTALAVQLHCPSQPPQTLLASTEEVAPADGPPTRALLFSTDPGGEVPPGAWLTHLAIGDDELLALL